LAFNSAGNLFVGTAQITEFSPNGGSATFASSFNTYALAFNSAGDLFAAGTDAAEPTGTILEFTPNGGSSTFASGFIASPKALAFNSAGDLFVAY
jgi:hypothetical protein